MSQPERFTKCGANKGATGHAWGKGNRQVLNRQVLKPSLEPPSLGTTEGVRTPVCFGPIRSVTSDFIQPPNASSRECASAICASGLCVMVMNQTRLKNSDHAVSQ